MVFKLLISTHDMFHFYKTIITTVCYFLLYSESYFSRFLWKELGLVLHFSRHIFTLQVCNPIKEACIFLND